jgi:dihydrofolate synthase/folylpolyglutamate synthase
VNYSETLDYLYNKLPMFSRLGSVALKKDLTNTKILCERLQNPQTKFKSIHIAGTNGKGSVSHMLAAVLQTAGYKTGLYTSPHLYDFRERIKIDGVMVPQEFIIDFVEKVQPWIEEIEPSFFEITVAMAFHYFAQEEVDIAVVEVGLGGRLDSTNVIHPELSIITNISFDHTNILGNTIEEIAAEKGGIIKEKIPVVISEREKKTETIFRKIAIEKSAPLLFAEDHFAVSSFELGHRFMSVVIEDKKEKERIDYKLDLPGIYQLKNLPAVLTAVKELNNQDWNIGVGQVVAALQEVKSQTGLLGRWEVIWEAPTIVLEVAHNEAGIQQMLSHLDQLHYRQLHIVLGMVKDKDIDKVLALLPKNAVYYFTQAHIPRALDKHQLQTQAQAFHLSGMVFENVNLALKRAFDSASPNDIVIVCGSIFLVAEVDKGKRLIQ